MKSDIFEYEISENQISITGFMLPEPDDETSVMAVIIPDKIAGLFVTEIASEAFSNGGMFIGSVVVPSSVKAIRKGAFKMCIMLENVILEYDKETGSGLEVLEDDVFAFTQVKELKLPQSLREIESAIDLSSMKLEVSEDNPYFTYDGYGLYKKADDGLELVMVSDFDEREYYEILPGTVRINKNGFAGQNFVKHVVFPASLTEADEPGFETCRSLKKITAHPDNPVYYNDENALFFRYVIGLMIVMYFGEGSEYTIPDEVRFLGERCFKGASFRKLTVGSGVYHVSCTAFKDCLNIEELTIKNDGTTMYIPETPAYRKIEFLTRFNSWDTPEYCRGASQEKITDRWQTFKRIDTTNLPMHLEYKYIYNYICYDSLYNSVLNFRDHYCMALCRIDNPAELCESTRLEYKQIIEESLWDVLRDICKREDMKNLELLCKHQFIKKDNIDTAIEIVNEFHLPKLMSFLLEFKAEHKIEEDFDFTL